MKHLIVEGVDRVGKDTFIERLRAKLEGTHVMVHNSAPPKNIRDPREKQQTMQRIYRHQTARFSEAGTADVVIWNRLHFSEAVYSHIIRGLALTYETFKTSEACIHLPLADTLVVVLNHEPHEIAGNDDGASTWTSATRTEAAAQIQQEQDLFAQCLGWSWYRGMIVDVRRRPDVIDVIAQILNSEAPVREAVKHA